MDPTRISRRDFLSDTALAVAGTLAGVGCHALPDPPPAGRNFVLAAEEAVGPHPFSLGILDLNARTRTALPLGFRGHQVIERPDAAHRASSLHTSTPRHHAV